MNLDEWQLKLHAHFSALRDKRDMNQAIFGLEHGLNEAERDDLQREVRLHVRQGAPDASHAIAWVVYASEVGYRYCGDEYWATFEEETPGWLSHGDRYWLRERFKWFHQCFGGAKPEGPWANHFSIICWPITHAILPRDLQRRLTEILYDLRFHFTSELLTSPAELGAKIEARGWAVSSRFQNLAQDHSLMGQIASAILLEGEGVGGHLLLPAAAQRIAKDVSRERQSWHWLKQARDFAKDRIKLQPLPSGGAKRPREPHPTEPRQAAKLMDIEPRVLLRPADPSQSTWNVFLTIPSLEPLLLCFPDEKGVLTGSPCLVAGCARVARGRLIYGAQHIPLARWPHADEVLLKFDQPAPQIEALLRTEYLLQPGPLWLFTIGSDGQAYEVRNRCVRAGQRYIVVASEPIVKSRYLTPLNIKCEGINGTLLTVPRAIDGEFADLLDGISLTHARSVDIWPAGLVAADWDGGGHGTWLADEHPVLGLRSDHEAECIIVRFGMDTYELASPTPGKPVFLEFPALPLGRHTVYVTTRYAAGTEAQHRELEISIREPKRWAGADYSRLVAIEVDPPDPSLEELWGGRVAIEIAGPAKRTVACSISLVDRRGDPLISRRLPVLQVPVNRAGWQSYFDQYVNKAVDIQSAYDLAGAARLCFEGSELGMFELYCEREFIPLRWTVSQKNKRYELTLHDDTGLRTVPCITRYGFSFPSEGQSITLPRVTSPLQASDEGGLYCARQGNFSASIVVPSILDRTVHSLAALQSAPLFRDQDTSELAVAKLIGTAADWTGARLAGALAAAMKQRDVLLGLSRHLFRLLGGAAWEWKELNASPLQQSIQELAGGITSSALERRIAVTLVSEYRTVSQLSCPDKVAWFTNEATKAGILQRRRIRVDRDGRTNGESKGLPRAWISEFALRLASEPGTVQEWAGSQLEDGIRSLKETPSLARAARFLVLASDTVASSSTYHRIYEGWEWE